jgi:aminoglycoside phosphotransferase (APT) family kinase protein
LGEASLLTNKIEQVVRTISPESTLLRTWPLQGGISAEMTAFEIQTPDGQISRMILRRPSEQTLQRNPHTAEDEFKILQLTKSLGLAIPASQYLDQSGRIFSTPYFVIEYVEGKPEFSPTSGEDFTLQLAKHLATIHSADYSPRDTSFLPQARSDCDEAIYKQLIHVQSPLDVQHIRETLGKVSFFPERNKPVLLHGDYWPGNILWRDGTIVAVIDWEDARIGDPLIDLAISRLDILWIFGLDAFQSFTHHYKMLMDIDYTTLPYWDLCASLRLARLIGADLTEWTAFFIPFGRHDITEHTLREHFKYFVTQAFEKLPIR